jgi:hypothetical protein
MRGRRGICSRRGVVTFLFDPAAYGLEVPTNTKVVVAGNFNGLGRRGRQPAAVCLKPRADRGHLGGRGPAGRHAPAAGRKGSGLQIRPQRHRLAAAAPGRAQRAGGWQGERESQAGPVPHRRLGNPCAYGRTAGPDRQATSCGSTGWRSVRWAMMTTPDGVFNKIRSDKPLGREPRQGARGDDLPDICAASAQCLAVLFRPAHGGDVDAGIYPVPPGRGIPDVEGSRRTGCGKSSTRGLDTWALLRIPGRRSGGRRGKRLIPHHVIGDPYGRAASKRGRACPS